MKDDGFRMYTIYDHPTDFPEHWVVRGLTVQAGGKITHDREAVLCASLREARAAVKRIYPFATFLTAEDPDPHIAEVWI